MGVTGDPGLNEPPIWWLIPADSLDSIAGVHEQLDLLPTIFVDQYPCCCTWVGQQLVHPVEMIDTCLIGISAFILMISWTAGMSSCIIMFSIMSNSWYVPLLLIIIPDSLPGSMCGSPWLWISTKEVKRNSRPIRCWRPKRTAGFTDRWNRRQVSPGIPVVLGIFSTTTQRGETHLAVSDPPSLVGLNYWKLILGGLI